jgi:excisionase family DNA binding protein
VIWTTAELAKQANLTQRHVRRLVKAGIIQGSKVGRDWIIFEDEAKRFLEERQKIEKTEDLSSEN